MIVSAPRERGRLRRTPHAARIWAATEQAAHAAPGATHVLADAALSAALRARATEIESAFAPLESSVRGLSLPLAEDAGRTGARLRSVLYGDLVVDTFLELVGRAFDRNLADFSDGEPVETLIRRWGFHAIDVTPCADGRLSGVVDYILRIPAAVVAFRTSHAGAMFDVEESLRNWESVELRRWRESEPNPASEPTRYLKIGVYHFSGANAGREGCAAHGHDALRAATALLERLDDFAQAVQRTHCCGASVATLLVGVDTDTDAIRVHVPDAAGRASVTRFVDNTALYAQTQHLQRDAAKDAIRDAVAACAGLDPADTATEGMRWFCGYLLKNNIGQIDAVRSWYGGGYADRGHTERIIVVGDALDDVQLRNLVFQAQMETVEEGGDDLDIGVRILRSTHEPRGLAVPVLAHAAYDQRIPGALERAGVRARRLADAILARYAHLAGTGSLCVRAIARGSDGLITELHA